ncbi:MAG: hypothetical protein QG635_1080 [Bacteroidota bacterium]|nr:hypothetical protein [Bacteroidota bacterium]
MQKYSVKEIFQILKELEDLSGRIKVVLEKEGKFSLDDITIVAKLYKERAPLLEILGEWRRTEEAVGFININQEEWDKKIAKLDKTDKINIEKMNVRIENLGNEIRELMKQQSVLVYLEEGSHEY